MLSRLKVEDFELLKEPLESGRQSRESLSFALLLSVFLQALLYYLTYYVAAEITIFPNITAIQEAHFWITIILILLSLVYAIPGVYKRSERVQYLLSILTIQNIGSVSFYLVSLFLIGELEAVTKESLLFFTKVTLIVGGLIVAITYISFYILIKKGVFRVESKAKMEMRSFLPLAVVVGIGLVFVVQYIVRFSTFTDIDDMFIVLLSMSIFFTMLVVLPVQLVILYCKFRFKSFNFNKNGYLKREN